MYFAISLGVSGYLSARLSVSLDVSGRLCSSLSVSLSERLILFLEAVLTSLYVSERLSKRAERLWACLCISLNVSGTLRVFLHVRLGIPKHLWTFL